MSKEKFLRDVAARINRNMLPGVWRFEDQNLVDGWVMVARSPGLLELQVQDFWNWKWHQKWYTDDGKETHKLLQDLADLLTSMDIAVVLDMKSIQQGNHQVPDNMDWTCPISLSTVPKERAVYVGPDVGSDGDATKRVQRVYNINSMRRLVGDYHSDETHVSPMSRRTFTSWNLRSLP